MKAANTSPASLTNSVRSPAPDPDYRRFLESWRIAQEQDAEFNGVPFPQAAYELPSPTIAPNPEPQELDGTGFTPLPPVAEPHDEDSYDNS